jgi:hypothetical protein
MTSLGNRSEARGHIRHVRGRPSKGPSAAKIYINRRSRLARVNEGADRVDMCGAVIVMNEKPAPLRLAPPCTTPAHQRLNGVRPRHVDSQRRLRGGSTCFSCCGR